MIHFFPRFSKTAEDTPFGDALRAIGAPHRIFGAAVQQNYRRRIALLLLGYPALAWTALRSAWRSMHQAVPPRAVVISSDVEALMFALVRLLPGSAKPAIVLMPFIFTARDSGAANRLRLAYYRFVMARVQVAICHSELETGRYERLFAGGGTVFAFVRWGTHVPGLDEILGVPGAPPQPGGQKRVVSAGRSGRDYPGLVAATKGLDCQVVIICNESAALQGVQSGGQIEVLGNCFGRAYLRQLLLADVVAVPLRVADISAGQMVLIQAMALGRALVVTDTPTVGDYLTHNETALLVPKGDQAALHAAIARLLEDRALAKRLGDAARAAYLAHFSNEVFMRDVVRTVQQHTS